MRLNQIKKQYLHKPKEDELPISERAVRRSNKKKVDNLFKYILDIDFYWCLTLSNIDKYHIYTNWSVYKEEYSTLSDFIKYCKEEGYGDLGKSRELKINDILKN